MTLKNHSIPKELQEDIIILLQDFTKAHILYEQKFITSYPLKILSQDPNVLDKATIKGNIPALKYLYDNKIGSDYLDKAIKYEQYECCQFFMLIGVKGTSTGLEYACQWEDKARALELVKKLRNHGAVITNQAVSNIINSQNLELIAYLYDAEDVSLGRFCVFLSEYQGIHKVSSYIRLNCTKWVQEC